MRRIAGAAVLLCALLAGVVAGAPGAAAGGRVPTDGYVLYYVVAERFDGKAENLWLIAARYLGDADRATEIYERNTGRLQPGGGRLADPSVLKAGWELVLPWDAVGGEVRYGSLTPVAPAPAPQSPAPQSPATAPPAGGPAAGAATSPPAARPPSAGAAPVASASAPVGGSGCVSASAASRSSSDWGQLRLAADQVWERSTGAGVQVAVVDSGVDGSRPELSGRVVPGADIVTGGDRGDLDCLGTGTAIAGLIAGGGDGGQRAGVAPEATVVPIRLVGADPKARPADAVTAIEVAASTGARVITVGAHVDMADESVAAALQRTADSGVVVVVPARTDAGGPGRAGSLLRVGAVGVDGQLAAAYRDGTVDVVAPGVDVRSVGITGTKEFVGSGAEYAAAFVAGTAALIAAAHPNMSAEQITQQITGTADRMGSALPDARYGYGMLNPAAAVTRSVGADVAPADTPVSPAGDGGGAGRTVAIVLVLLAAAVAVVLIVLRLRRSLAARGEDTVEPGHDPNPAFAEDGRETAGRGQRW